MSEIPDDIMKAASDCYDGLQIVYDGWDEDVVRHCIAGAILAERNRSQWQPIETAPKDGTVVDLLHISGDRFTDEFWIEENGRGFWTCCLSFDDEFTHWMPLPAPPITNPAAVPPPAS